MRIRSSFKDYYDKAQAFGQDKELVYVRQTKEVEGHYGIPSVCGRFLGSIPNWFVLEACLGFCGKPHLGFRIGTSSEQNDRWIWSVKDADRYVEQYFKKKGQEEYHNEGKNNWKANTFLRDEVEKFFATDLSTWKGIQRAFEDAEKEHAPVWLVRDEKHFNKEKGMYYNTLVLNPCLREIDFARVVDPYTAFQEISMWLGNQAFPNRPIPHVPDDTLAEAKGFDQFSFRKPKSKK